MKRIYFSILTISMCTAIFAQQDSRVLTQKLHSCKIEGVSGPVLCGSFAVFENRELRKGRMIQLKIVVIPALQQKKALTPIFYFEGGPGIAATNSASFYSDPTAPYRKNHDIVLIDIRGTGGSNPLNCSSLQVKKELKEQFDDMYPIQAVKECYDSLSKKADLKQYTTTNIVKDIEDVRKWLGYGKINIYGLSYGTRVALVYLKMFPSSIESCILWSPVPTYARMPLNLARFAQNSLQQLFNNCGKDSACRESFPNLESEFNTLMEKRKEKPFRYSTKNSSGNSSEISISWNAFQTKFRSMLYSPESIRKVPYIIHQAYLDNLDPFISLFPKGADTSSFLAEGLYLCVTCTEDVPFIPKNKIDSATNGTFMATYRIDQQVGACSQWTKGSIPKGFFDPTVTNIPVLILSGELDPITPTSMAKEIASHLSNCTFVLIPEMSHTFDGLNHAECFDELCVRFIENPSQRKINTDCTMEMKPPPFKTKD